MTLIQAQLIQQLLPQLLPQLQHLQLQQTVTVDNDDDIVAVITVGNYYLRQVNEVNIGDRCVFVCAQRPVNGS